MLQSLRLYGVVCAIVAAFLTISACDGGGAAGGSPAQAGSASAPTASAPATVANHVVGTVKDEHGNALADATIEISGVSFAGGTEVDFTTNTDAHGQYKMKLPEGVYAFRAFKLFDYHDWHYKITLHPLDATAGQRSHQSADGIHEDFVLKVQGANPNSVASREQERFFGGELFLQEHDAYLDALGRLGEKHDAPFPTGSVIEVTLTPTGPLLDGSQGAVIKRSVTLKEVPMWSRYSLTDIPLGQYTASATVKEPGGNSMPVRVATYGGNDSNRIKPSEAGATATLIFYPKDFSPLVTGVWPSKLYLMR